MGNIKNCKICNSTMWVGTDKPQNLREGICDWCMEHEPEKVKELKKLKPKDYSQYGGLD